MDHPLQPLPSPTYSGPGASPWAVLLVLLLGLTVGSALGNLLSLGLGRLLELDLAAVLATFSPSATPVERNFLRGVNLLAHFCTFSLGALGTLAWAYRRGWWAQAGLGDSLTGPSTLGGILLMLGFFPLAQLVYWLNQLLPLPDEWLRQEAATAALFKGLLVMNSTGELLFNLLLMGLVPALGEELVFRGVLQRQLAKILPSPIAAIWISALLFSAIHFQFAGFLPRWLLGAALGYLFFWSGNLWLPIVAHGAFNAFQVLAYYLLKEQAGQLGPDAPASAPNGFLVALGLLLIAPIIYQPSRWFGAKKTA